MKRHAVVRWIGVAGLTLALASCSSKAGPFVTNVSSNGAGGLTIEKCMMRLDRMINVVANSDCTNTTIQLVGRQK